MIPEMYREPREGPEGCAWSLPPAGGILTPMAREPQRVDPGEFEIRRRIRDTLAQLLRRGWWEAREFEEAMRWLSEQRGLALRQLLAVLRSGKSIDEVAALEVLGGLALPEDADALAEIANDPSSPEQARVATALTLLGQRCGDRLLAGDVTRLVIRWQARFLVDEPGLRPPLLKLYREAGREERARWAVLQDQEIDDAESRAAIFEMLLAVESDDELRRVLLEALGRHLHPSTRASLRRVEAQTPEERDWITARLAEIAAETDPSSVPTGWRARIGFCDGSGTFPLRIDFRPKEPTKKARTVIVILDLVTGVRESLSLVGDEVERYDGLGDQDGTGCADEPAIPEVGVPEALEILHRAEERSVKRGSSLPHDHARARRLLDGLADVHPRAPELSLPIEPALWKDTAQLLRHPGYSGWFYDAGDHELDGLRLEVLGNDASSRAPSADQITRAAACLARSGERDHLSQRLMHNARVHELAGESELARRAAAAAAACKSEDFSELPLARMMLRESLHPGHYFFSPVPDTTRRSDLVALLVGSDRPTRRRVFAVDLAWILTRATDVWLSRLPYCERMHGDESQAMVLALAEAGVRWVTHWLEQNADAEPRRSERVGFGPYRRYLARSYREALDRHGWTGPPHDARFHRYAELLTGATEQLVFRTCLGECALRCPAHPRRLGLEGLGDALPAGDDAENRVRTWPGLFVHRPSAVQEAALAALLSPADTGRGTFRCGVCGEERPLSARSRSFVLSVQGGDREPVCRRCQGRYRRDPEFQTEVIRGQGRILV